MANTLQRGRAYSAALMGLMSLTGLTVFSGCAGGDPDKKPVAKVTGTVTFDGQPVTGGILTFAPVGGEKGKVAGKSGQAVIGSNGSFTVSTYGDGDGAVVGQHTISFAPPVPAPAQSAAAAHAEGKKVSNDPPPFAGLLPKTPEVKVASGDNKITVELVKSTVPPAK